MINGRAYYSIVDSEGSIQPYGERYTCYFLWFIILFVIGALEVIIGFIQNTHILGFLLGVLLCLLSAGTVIVIIVLERNRLMHKKRTI